MPALSKYLEEFERQAASLVVDGEHELRLPSGPAHQPSARRRERTLQSLASASLRACRNLPPPADMARSGDVGAPIADGIADMAQS